VSIEDDLETDVASLRRELLDWILTEVRSGRDRPSLAGAPLAQDLVDVVRGGLKGAADEAAQRIENQRAEVLVKALDPTFRQLLQELRTLHAQLTDELTSRGGDADTRLASLERSMADIRKSLLAQRGGVAAAAAGGADRTDEIIDEIRRLGGGDTAPGGRRWTTPMVAGLAALALVLGGGGGWLVGASQAPKLTANGAVADQAEKLRVSLTDLAGAPTTTGANAPKLDPQTIAADAADVASALEASATAATPDALAKAHQQAIDALTQLHAALDAGGSASVESPARPTATPQASTPPAPHTAQSAHHPAEPPIHAAEPPATSAPSSSGGPDGSPPSGGSPPGGGH
jgi:hypothetical protein